MFGIDDVIAGGFSAASQHFANQANQRLSREQMQFQERMSSTAHQREVADLRRAGLNPLLSVNAGASSPGGSMAHMEPSVAKGVASAQESRRLRSEIALQDSQATLNRANARVAEANLGPRKAISDVARDASSLYGRLKGGINSARDAVGRYFEREERQSDEERVKRLKATERRARARKASSARSERFREDSSGVFSIPYRRP